VASAKVSPISPQSQSLGPRPDNDVERSIGSGRRFSMHVAIIQLPVRKWEKPWRHQRAIVLVTESVEETRLRLYLEGRIAPGEYILRITAVGE
jgi:hypothetical protein